MNRLTQVCLIAVCLLLTGGPAAAEAVPDAAAVDDEVFALENCVQTQRIRRTEIVDDSTILFFMTPRDRIFVNRLPRRCSGLRLAGTFSYRSTTGRLCNVDIIRVVRDLTTRTDIGAGCALGMFRPVTGDEVEVIRNREPAPPEDPAPGDPEPADPAPVETGPDELGPGELGRGEPGSAAEPAD